jgi:hypothetical protein
LGRHQRQRDEQAAHERQQQQRRSTAQAAHQVMTAVCSQPK